MSSHHALALLLSLVVVTTDAPLAQELNGEISGVVVDATGTPLPSQRVELSRRRGSERRVVLTNENGSFAYTMLSPGEYRLELVIEGRVVARSPQIELSGSVSQVGGVTLAVPPATLHKERSELAKLLIFVGVSVGVAAAAIVLSVIAAGGV